MVGSSPSTHWLNKIKNTQDCVVCDITLARLLVLLKAPTPLSTYARVWLCEHISKYGWETDGLGTQNFRRLTMNAQSHKNQCLDSIIVSNGGSTGRTEELKPKADKQQEWLAGWALRGATQLSALRITSSGNGNKMILKSIKASTWTPSKRPWMDMLPQSLF